MFRDDVDYREGTKDFVTDVAKAIRGELEHASDLPNPLARYSKLSSADRALGRVICELRARRSVTQEQLADTTGFSVEFVAALEKGQIVPAVGVWGTAYYALEPTEQENEELMNGIFRDNNREEVIREVIETYYGWSLWAFKPGVCYEEAIEPFIKSLAALGESVVYSKLSK
ncbi:MAG: helix-turn-helix domain-containing protein [Patescibacteria group bacterium]